MYDSVTELYFLQHGKSFVLVANVGYSKSILHVMITWALIGNHLLLSS